MKAEQAMIIALQALGWLASDPARIGAFLNLAGMAPGDLAASASDPEFLAAVVDFILSEEASVLAFAHENGMAPGQLQLVRMALPGGQLPHWT